jgi:hypothetical protein
MGPFLIVIVSAVGYSWMKRGRQHTSRPEGKSLSDRENDARRDIQSIPRTAIGDPFDFEADQRPPRY